MTILPYNIKELTHEAYKMEYNELIKQIKEIKKYTDKFTFDLMSPDSLFYVSENLAYLNDMKKFIIYSLVLYDRKTNRWFNSTAKETKEKEEETYHIYKYNLF